MPKKKKEPEENPMAALPLGMSFALAQNPEAMAHYARMDKAHGGAAEFAEAVALFGLRSTVWAMIHHFSNTSFPCFLI